MNYITEPNIIIIPLGGHALSNVENLDAVLAPSFKGEKCSKPQHHLKTFRSKACKPPILALEKAGIDQ